MITSETKTLNMTFVDEAGKTLSYNILDPKEGLTKEQVEAVAKTVLDGKLFTGDDGELKALKSSQIVTRQIEKLA